MREFGDYRTPGNPRDIGRLLEKAHKTVGKIAADPNVSAKKRQVEIASVGSSGGNVQRSSSRKALDPHKRSVLEQGGWSEEEIKRIELNLE